MSMPHILVLNEPTNHLDMQNVHVLADGLDEFNGGIIHDSILILHVFDDEEMSQIWAVENGAVKFFGRTFEDKVRDVGRN